MISLARNDTSILARWWWTVDRLILFLVLMLIMIGVWLVFTASPAVAARDGFDSLLFFYKQLVFLVPSLFALFFFSFLSDKWVRRMAVVGLPITVLLIILTILIGDPVKGATRWLNFFGIISLQPSEFLKPFFIVVSAWLLSASFSRNDIPVRTASLVMFIICAVLLMLQPDFGQTILLGAVWLTQMLLAGLPLFALLLVGLVALVSFIIIYSSVPYIASRINRFIDPDSGDRYQVDLAIDAFEAGGLLGRGPGEGTVKLALPDAHADYIFAVLGEEFGAVPGVILIMLFATIVVRGLVQLIEEQDPFRLMAAGGLLVQFGLQALINIGVSTDLLPSKGMTLPFISYGGSSMLALSIGMGMVLALTRRDRVQRSLAQSVRWGGQR